jgi:DNA-binding CsgD family transcriptional regulator
MNAETGGGLTAEEREVEALALLWPSEADVLRRLADGQVVGDIARARVTSRETVRGQVRGVLTKLEVTSQLQAVAMFYRAQRTKEHEELDDAVCGALMAVKHGSYDGLSAEQHLWRILDHFRLPSGSETP